MEIPWFQGLLPDTVEHFEPTTFHKYWKVVIVLLLITAAITSTMKRSIQSVNFMMVMALLFAMIAFTEVLRTFVLFSRGFWNPMLIDIFNWMYTSNLFMQGCFMIFVCIGGHAIITHSKPWWPAILAFKFDVPIIDTLWCQTLVFASTCVLACACGPAVGSVAFIGLLVTLIIGLIIFILLIIEQSDKDKAPSAATPGTLTAGTVAAGGKSVSISVSSRPDNIWRVHMGPKGLTEGKLYDDFIKDCKAPHRSHKILVLFKKKLIAAGFAVHGNLPA